MKITFMKNGIDTNEGFIAYQSINSISPIKYKPTYEHYDWMTDKYTSDEVSKYAYFIIATSEHKYQINIDECVVSIPRLNEQDKNMSIWKYLFNNPLIEGCSAEVYKWLYNRDNMEEIIKETKELRDSIVNKFNEWKGK